DRCGSGGRGAGCGGPGGGGGGAWDPELRADEAGRAAGGHVEEREHDGGAGGVVVRAVERRRGRVAAGGAYRTELKRMEGSKVHVTTEIGPLQAVVCHTPGPEVLAVTPSTREDFLYDDIIDLEQARREHHRFTAILSRFCEVYEVRDLLEEIADEAEV